MITNVVHMENKTKKKLKKKTKTKNCKLVNNYTEPKYKNMSTYI